MKSFGSAPLLCASELLFLLAPLLLLSYAISPAEDPLCLPTLRPRTVQQIYITNSFFKVLLQKPYGMIKPHAQPLNLGLHYSLWIHNHYISHTILFINNKSKGAFNRRAKLGFKRGKVRWGWGIGATGSFILQKPMKKGYLSRRAQITKNKNKNKYQEVMHNSG